ncbi:hypothetical protein SDC9_80502 [bioreactor metagenome]|uniref:Uncharacterized protein n=1 Tax=bioreactor metagenome TaxID=1076179 RepID=A0A644Z1N7_9ZZZZ
MLERQGRKELSALLERVEDGFVRFFDEQPVPGRAAGHVAGSVDQLHKRQFPFFAHAGVVFAEGGRDVDDARAVFKGHVSVRNDAVAFLIAKVDGQRKQRLVFHADELLSLAGGNDLRILAQHLPNQRFREDVGICALFHRGVGFLCVDAEGYVARQRPGRGRPGKERLGRVALDEELRDNGGFLNVLISLRDLVAGQRGAAARAVGYDLVALVEQALLVNRLERPPDGLDIVVLVGDVRVFHIRPEADPVGHLFPLGLVLPDRLFTFLDERLDAVSFDLLLAVETELFFHFDLHGQAVGIPAGFAEHVVTLHGLVARDDILDRAR